MGVKEVVRKFLEGRWTIEELEDRVQHLEVRCAQLHGENEDLHRAVESPARIKLLEEQLRVLDAATTKMIETFKYVAVGEAEVATIRTCRAILDQVRAETQSVSTTAKSDDSGEKSSRVTSSGSTGADGSSST